MHCKFQIEMRTPTPEAISYLEGCLASNINSDFLQLINPTLHTSRDLLIQFFAQINSALLCQTG